MNITTKKTFKQINKVKKNKHLRKISKIIVGALLISISSRFFVIYAGIYASGVSGFTQGITYTIWDLSSEKESLWGLNEVEFKNTVYWMFYAIINVPIIFWAYFKFGKKYIGWSMLAFGSALGFSMMFTYVPAFAESGFIPDYDPLHPDTGPATNYAVSTLSAVIGAVIGGIGLGLIFQEGTSSLGTDPITRYVARERGRSLVSFIFTFSMVNILIWTTIEASIKGEIGFSFSNYINNVIFNYTMLSSVLYMAIYSLVISWMYPTSRKFLVHITSEKSRSISNHLKDIGFHRGQTLVNSEGGFTGHKQKTILITINSEELHDLTDYVKEIDPAAFIVATITQQIITGNKEITWTPKTKEDAKVQKQINKSKEFWKKSSNNKGSVTTNKAKKATPKKEDIKKK